MGKSKGGTVSMEEDLIVQVSYNRRKAFEVNLGGCWWWDNNVKITTKLRPQMPSHPPPTHTHTFFVKSHLVFSKK